MIRPKEYRQRATYAAAPSTELRVCAVHTASSLHQRSTGDENGLAGHAGGDQRRTPGVRGRDETACGDLPRLVRRSVASMGSAGPEPAYERVGQLAGVEPVV